MTTLELQAKKAELITSIINDVNNEEQLEAVSTYLKEVVSTVKEPPCQYSREELKDRLKLGRIAEKEGNYKTQAEMRRKHSL